MIGIKKNKKIKNAKNKGFSLLESILAVFLVAIGLVASLKLLTAGVSQSLKNRDQFTASLLAQEGVELARNMRDNAWVDGDPSTESFHYFPSLDQNKCRTDKNYTGIIDTTTNRCVGAAASYTRLYMNGNYYVDATSGGNETRYYRRIKFAYYSCDASTGVCSSTGQKSGSNQVRVTSLVSWNGAIPVLNESNCNAGNSCAYTQVSLNNWGE